MGLGEGEGEAGQRAMAGALGGALGWCAWLPHGAAPPPRLWTPPVLPPRGRLFNQIRSREGLAYSVSGGWSSTPIDHRGLFIASAETAQPAALLGALRAALEGAAAAPPTAEELQNAKQVTGRGALSLGWRAAVSFSPGAWLRLPPTSYPFCHPHPHARAGGPQLLCLPVWLPPRPAVPPHHFRPAGHPAGLPVQARLPT